MWPNRRRERVHEASDRNEYSQTQSDWQAACVLPLKPDSGIEAQLRVTHPCRQPSAFDWQVTNVINEIRVCGNRFSFDQPPVRSISDGLTSCTKSGTVNTWNPYEDRAKYKRSQYSFAGCAEIFWIWFRSVVMRKPSPPKGCGGFACAWRWAGGNDKVRVRSSEYLVRYSCPTNWTFPRANCSIYNWDFLSYSLAIIPMFVQMPENWHHF